MSSVAECLTFLMTMAEAGYITAQRPFQTLFLGKSSFSRTLVKPETATSSTALAFENGAHESASSDLSCHMKDRARMQKPRADRGRPGANPSRCERRIDAAIHSSRKTARISAVDREFFPSPSRASCRTNRSSLRAL